MVSVVLTEVQFVEILYTVHVGADPSVGIYTSSLGITTLKTPFSFGVIALLTLTVTEYDVTAPIIVEAWLRASD